MDLISNFNAYMHAEKGVPFPASCQKMLQIQAITREGIMALPNRRFSALWKFSDINYRGQSDDHNAGVILQLGNIYDAIPDDFKIIIHNRNQSDEELEKGYLFGTKYALPMQKKVAQAFDQLILDRIQEGRKGLKQDKYILATTTRSNVEAASAHFVELDTQLSSKFASLGSSLARMDCAERVKLLHDYFHPENPEYRFDFDAAKKERRDALNDIVPSGIRPGDNELQIDGRFYRFLYVRKWPESGVDDRFIAELTNLPYPMFVTLDFAPIPPEATNSRLERMYMQIEQSIYNEKSRAARNGVVASDNFYKQKESDEIRSTMASISQRGESMLFSGMTVGISADSIEELKTITESCQSTAQSYGFILDIAWLRQIESMVTALPIGLRQTRNMRTLLSQNAAALMPFATRDVADRKGLYYGQNSSSKQPIFHNRHQGNNAHGFTFGETGSGKSMENKFADQQEVLRDGEDTVFYFIDPQREKQEFVEMNGGAYVTFAITSNNRMNPLEYSPEDVAGYEQQTKFLARKINFLIALVQMNMDISMSGIYKNIITRCTTQMYESWFCTLHPKQPQLEDFYMLLKKQEEPEAREIAMALESMIYGPLAIFNCQTTVDMNNHIIGFGFNELSDDLMGASLLTIMEFMSHQLYVNHNAGHTTYISVEEFRYVTKYKVALEYFQDWYSMVRKFSGMIMATTQNIASVAQDEIMKTMINNASFLVLMAQKRSDIELLSEITGIDLEKLSPLLTASAGTGLIKVGSDLIPFDNRIPEDNLLYQLWNTDDNAKKKARLERQAKNGTGKHSEA